MIDDIINQAIETATPAPAENVPAQPIGTPQATEEKAPIETLESEDTPFPKKAVNALSRRDKQIGKLQAQLAAERAELAKYRDQPLKSPTDNSPKEESYDNYGEYLKAVARHEAKQELAASSKQQQDNQDVAEQEAWHTERQEYAVDKARHAIENIPDYKQLFMENSDILQSLPPHVERAFLEADEPALAFYALAKEGKLDAILSMSPGRAAIEIGKAEIRGEALSKAKQITKAPAPIEGLKGVGSSAKTLETMSSSELLKWVRSK